MDCDSCSGPVGPGRRPPARGDQPCRSAEIAWRSGLTQTAPLNFVAVSSAVAAVVGGPPYRDDAGSGGPGVGNPSASGERCDVGTAGAASVGMGWSVAAGTAVWVKAVGIAPG